MILTRPTIPNSPYPVFTHESRQNPHPLYKQMRREMPVAPILGPQSGFVFWVLTRYDDCMAAFKHPQLGRDHLRLPEDLANKFGGKPVGVWAAINRHMLNLDPPDHTRLRGLVHKAFTPALIETMRSRTQFVADSLIARIQARGDHHFDLINDYGFPLPITVIAELLGVPVSDQDDFRRWTKTLVFGTDEAEMATAAFEFVMYINNLIEEKLARPQPDLLTNLLQAEEAGDKLDREELLSMIFLLLVAGHETTVNLIGNGMLALFNHPDQRAKLQAHPDLIRTAVEEMLRYEGPVDQAMWRIAMDSVSIAGVEIPQGDIVTISLYAGNRDPEVFENPDTFDITRDPNKHLGFGSGIHYCLGSPLARMEGAIAINTLLARLPQVQLMPGMNDRLEWSDSTLLRGLKSLEVTY